MLCNMCPVTETRTMSIVLLLCAFLISQASADVTAQTDRPGDATHPAVILHSVPLDIPDEVKKTGLGGTMKVMVSIDKDGNVSGVEDVIGPDGVCRQVTQLDVVAMRNASKLVALQTKFVPAQSKGRPISSWAWLDFEFPRPALKDKLVLTTPDGEVRTYPVTAGSDEREPRRSGVLNGRALSMPKPPYPPAARSVRASGTVSIRVFIDENGEVFSASAVSGHPLLRPAAEASACKARFSTTKLDGAPVRVSGVITYNFVP